MIRHKVMRQLMAQNNPPVDESISPIPVLNSLHLMQLLEISEVAEYASTPIERDSLARRIVEDIHGILAHGEDTGAIDEERGESV